MLYIFANHFSLAHFLFVPFAQILYINLIEVIKRLFGFHFISKKLRWGSPHFILTSILKSYLMWESDWCQSINGSSFEWKLVSKEGWIFQFVNCTFLLTIQLTYIVGLFSRNIYSQRIYFLLLKGHITILWFYHMKKLHQKLAWLK